eukprot:IDg21989t1
MKPRSMTDDGAATHYVAAIASHVSGDGMKCILRQTILAVSPMGPVEDPENDCQLGDAEASKFNAEAHLK